MVGLWDLFSHHDGRDMLRDQLAQRAGDSRTECVNAIIQFLTFKNYNICTFKELLQPISLDTFLELWNTLLRSVDKNCVLITADNILVEVPRFYEEFGYPHSIKPSQLSVPIDDSEWDSTLKLLTWLCKLLYYEENDCMKDIVKCAASDYLIPNHDSKMNITNVMIARSLTDLTTKHYKLFTNGAEDGQTLINEFNHELSDITVNLQGSHDSKLEAYEKLKGNLIEIQEDCDSTEDVKAKVDMLESELKEAESLAQKIYEDYKDKEVELEAVRELLEDESNKLMGLESKNSQLKLSNNNEDANSLQSELSNILKNIGDHEVEINRLNSNVLITKEKIRNAYKKFMSVYEDIIRLLLSHKVDPSSWMNLDKFTLDLDGSTVDDILGVNSETFLKIIKDMTVTESMTYKNVHDMKTQENAAIHELEGKFSKLEDDIAKLEENKKNISSTLTTCEELMPETEEVIEDITKDAERNYESAKREFEFVMNEYNRLESECMTQEMEIVHLFKDYISSLMNIIDHIQEDKIKNCGYIKGLVQDHKVAIDSIKSNL